MNFTDFTLHTKILQAIAALGFEQPTAIQEQLIPEILTGERDIIGLAQTGTGKTAAFGLPLIERLHGQGRKDSPGVKGLVLCPTRELCLQITEDLRSFAEYLPAFTITPVYGGADIVRQMKEIRRGTDIIVATPGRILDLIRRRAADISLIEYLILDEADIMLNMGFKEELDSILAEAPKEKKTVLLSATMPPEVSRIAATYMENPLEISVGEKNAGVATVDHRYYLTHPKKKYETLKRLIDYWPKVYGIIFCRTKLTTQELAEKIIKDGYNAEPLHGDLSQTQRSFVMSKFREGQVKLLIATDIAARGLDVQDLTHIIHYDLPDEKEIYNHRSGRTGRAGKAGISMAIITPRELRKIKTIERSLKRKIERTEIPGKMDIWEKQIYNSIEEIKNAPPRHDQLGPFVNLITEATASMEREELVQRILSLKLGNLFEYYQELQDPGRVTEEFEDERKMNTLRSSRKTKRRKTPFTYLSVNLGKKHQILPPQLIGLINKHTRNRQIQIGHIDIKNNESRIQVESSKVREVHKALNDTSYRGKLMETKIIS